MGKKRIRKWWRDWEIKNEKKIKKMRAKWVVLFVYKSEKGMRAWDCDWEKKNENEMKKMRPRWVELFSLENKKRKWESEKVRNCIYIYIDCCKIFYYNL